MCEPLGSRASIGFPEFLGQLRINTPPNQKKGLVLQRGLEGIPEPEGFERTRGDNQLKPFGLRIDALCQGFYLYF